MTRRGGVVLGLLLCTAGCGPSRGLATLTSLGSTPTGQLFWLAFDADDVPWIGMGDGFYRWDGAAWVPAPSQGLTGMVNPYLRFDRAGNALAGSQGTAFRLPKGGSTWQPLATDGLVFDTPVEASDGTLYAPAKQLPTESKRRVYFLKPGDTTWTDSGVDIDPVAWLPTVDTKGNLWVDTWSGGGADDGVQRLHERETERFPGVWGRAVLGDVHRLVGADASGLYGASHNYGSNYGEVFRWDPATKEKATLADGTKCQSPTKDFECEFRSGVFVGGTTRAPNGDVYELFAHQNGDPPALMVLRAGEDTWWPLLLDLVPGVAMAVSPRGTLYLYGNLNGTAVAKVTP